MERCAEIIIGRKIRDRPDQGLRPRLANRVTVPHKAVEGHEHDQITAYLALPFLIRQTNLPRPRQRGRFVEVRSVASAYSRARGGPDAYGESSS